MKVFVGWATDDGYVSKALAVALHNWLPKVIQALDPWLSVDDLTPGRRWNNEIQQELNKTAVGIFCLTKDGQFSQWQSFEAGALAKSVKEDSYVVPMLVEMRPGDLEGPLKAFQSLSTDKDDLLKLVSTLNEALKNNGGRSLEPDRLQDSFERAWSELAQAIAELPKPSGSQPRSRDTAAQNFTSEVMFSQVLDTYDEIIKLARDTNNVVNQLMTSSGSSVNQRRMLSNPSPITLSLYDVFQPETQVDSFSLSKHREDADVDIFLDNLNARVDLEPKDIEVIKTVFGGNSWGYNVSFVGGRTPTLRTVEQAANATGFSIHSVRARPD